MGEGRIDFRFRTPCAWLPDPWLPRASAGPSAPAAWRPIPRTAGFRGEPGGGDHERTRASDRIEVPPRSLRHLMGLPPSGPPTGCPA